MSSKKTSGLGLHLWEPEDDFLRTEFNENTQKLDTAAKAAAAVVERYVTLLDVTTTAAAQQVDLSVSHIDFTSLWEAELFCGISETAEVLFLIRANGLTSGYYVSEGDKGTYGTSNCWAYAPVNGGRSFKLLTDNPNAQAVMSYTAGYFGTFNNNSAFIIYQAVGMAPVTWGSLRTINVVHNNGTFPAGTRFFLRGVKK